MHVQGRSIQVVDKFQNLDELSNTVKQFSYRVLKEDCLDLPPKNFIKRHITLTVDQKRVYEQMKKAAMAVLNGKVTTTMTVLTQLMRLHQITCGYVTADDGSTQAVDSNRLNELMNILEETEGKVIIWANYQLSVGDIIQKIIKVYGKDSYVHYYGLTPQEDRQDFIRKFSKRS
jgi:SNF2 family DNA or RNA helicase